MNYNSHIGKIFTIVSLFFLFLSNAQSIYLSIYLSIAAEAAAAAEANCESVR